MLAASLKLQIVVSASGPEKQSPGLRIFSHCSSENVSHNLCSVDEAQKLKFHR
jgi:hypothetical protein